MGIIMLNEEQIRKLARTIYYREVGAIHSIPFKSEPERVKYLRECKSCHDAILSHLDEASELKRTYEYDELRADIAHTMYRVVTIFANFAFQCLRNYGVRFMYVKKIRDHWAACLELIKNATSVEEAAKLTKAALAFEEYMLECSQRFEYSVSRFLSKAFGKATLRELVQRYKNALNFTGAFEDLLPVDQIKVYSAIAEAYGQGRVLTEGLEGVFKVIQKVLPAVGLAVFVVTAGLMVWDIYTSANMFQTAVRDVAMIGSAISGGFVADIALAIVRGLFFEAEISGIEALVLAGLGFGIGLGAGILIGIIAGELIDWFFSSGGKDGGGSKASFGTIADRFYIAPLQDGRVIARQITHH